MRAQDNNKTISNRSRHGRVTGGHKGGVSLQRTGPPPIKKTVIVHEGGEGRCHPAVGDAAHVARRHTETQRGAERHRCFYWGGARRRDSRRGDTVEARSLAGRWQVIHVTHVTHVMHD
jgi:hypothetical protein